MKFASRTTGAVLGLVAIATFSVALPASAANVAEWGVFGDSLSHDAQVDFTNPDFPDAQIMVFSESEYGHYSPNGEGEGFTANDPVGALVGANQTSTDDNFLKVSTYDLGATTTTITFDSPVPAGQLVLAISDIDSDRAEVTMLGASGGSISAAGIIGTATTLGFNWDSPSNTEDIPLVGSDFTLTTVEMGEAPWNTEGSTGWVRPSADVSTIVIATYTEDGEVSSQRIWIGQVIEGNSGGDLASTGAGDSLYLAALAGGAVLAAGGVMAVRRRQA
jgi:LPXTG-motif cell wall-anchored protein